MIRNLVSTLLLGALGLLLLAFAVGNRQTVTVAFDPFDQDNPALVVSLPVYQLTFLLLIGGVIIGGCAAWLGQSKWRQRARRAEAENLATVAPRSRADGPRLVIPPPAA
jgi:uncharacterized integral membrane protein